jgi:hypothetical protein
MKLPWEVQCGFLITDIKDPAYNRFQALRQRFGAVLHSAAEIFKEANGDGFIDAIKLTVREGGPAVLSFS